MTPFEKTPESRPGQHGITEGESRKPETLQGNEAQENEKDRQQALGYLIETGRAKTPEDAERYLDSLNHLKDRLLAFLQEGLPKNLKQHLPNEGPSIRVGIFPERLKNADESTIAALIPDNINRTDTNIWALERRVAPPFLSRSSEGYSYRDGLQVPFADDEVVILPDPSGWTARTLKNYLSREELAFLNREYQFALQDLAKQLREMADETAAQREYKDRSWQPLSKIEGKGEAS